MHKKLEAELVSLAHSILKMKNRSEALALRSKAREIYEKLSVLTFIDDYRATTTNLDISKEELLDKLEQTLDNKENVDSKELNIEPSLMENSEDNSKEIQITKDEDIFEPKFDSVRIDIESLKSNQISLKEEFRDSISADKTSTLFDDTDKKGHEKKTLNDRLVKNTIQVGLNDRIAFVNHLFNFNQQDFNRVLSQLNTFKTENEAIDFINNKVKPDYDWTGKEEFQERLITLIERKFT
ncbi:MAG: hypothetical protein QNK20_10760 [Aureibaculum sp.]|nr:hypothetical protein [Aureibaculum sp.]